MRREPPVRIREGLGVKLPRATRLLLGFVGPRTEAEAIRRLRPAVRVLDGRVVIPPKGGHNHGPWQSAGRAERTAVATLDRPVADERPERAGLLCPTPP